MDTLQSNKKESKKQHLRPIKIDNRLKQLIERHPGFRHQYRERIQKYLLDNGHHVYAHTAIYRIVYDLIPLNEKNMVVKEAIEHLVEEFESKIFA